MRFSRFASFSPSLLPLVLLACGGDGIPGYTQIVTGGNHSCGRRGTGEVECWGSNLSGRLGNPQAGPESNRPVRVVLPPEAGEPLDLACGGAHTCAVGQNGQAYCWGSQIGNQLGNSSVTGSSDVPVLVNGPSGAAALQNVRTIDAGLGHSCAALGDGSVYCWGSNSKGQLGNPVVAIATLSAGPVAVLQEGGGELREVSDVCTAAEHSCALKENGAVFCWGWNNLGQLGNPAQSAETAAVAQAVAGFDGSAPSARATFLRCKGSHSCAITEEGKVRCWGGNFNGQLGSPALGQATQSATPVSVVDVSGSGELGNVRWLATGNSHSCAALNDGRAVCWGSNLYSKLGNTALSGESSPTPVVALRAIGELRNIEVVATGTDHSCALDRSGRAWCWGRNTAGQLGDGSNIDRPTAVLVTDPLNP